MPQKQAVVIGGSGFLGIEVMKILCESGEYEEIVCFSRSFPTPPYNEKEKENVSWPANMIWKKGDVMNAAESELEQLLKDANVCFHLAGVVEHSRTWIDKEMMYKLHVDATLSLIRAAAKAKCSRVVYASTSGVLAVQANANDRIVDDDESDISLSLPLIKDWPYYHSKWLAEQQALKLAKQLGVDLVAMRPSLILGPGDYRLSSCQSVVDFLNGDVPLIPNGGVSFVDVRDCAAAFKKAGEISDASLVSGKTFLLGDYNMSFFDYFTLISKISKVKMPLLYKVKVPFVIIHIFCYIVTFILSLFGKHNPTLDPVVAEMSNVFWYLNSNRARKVLSFNPRPSQETLESTISFLRLRVLNKKN